MAVQEERTPERGGGFGSNILEGAVIVLVSSLVVPALVLGLRPVAKTVMKGGLCLTGMVKQLVTATSEGWSAWVAEARGQARVTMAPRGEGDVAKPAGGSGPAAPYGYWQKVGCLENFSRCGRGYRFEMHTIAQVLDP